MIAETSPNRRLALQRETVPVEYGAGWCSRRAPSVQLAELRGGQAGFGPKPLRMGLYWKLLAWLQELKSA